jgi:hypothetical protein
LSKSDPAVKGPLKIGEDALRRFVVTVTGIVGVGREERHRCGDVRACVALEPKKPAD